MNYTVIDSFLALSETLNYTKAAEKLYISQPSLSRSIQMFEDETGLILFSRSSKAVKLTKAGEVLAEELRAIRGQYTAAIERAKDAQRGYMGEIRICVMSGLLLEEFGQTILDYEKQYNNIRFNITSVRLRDLWELLNDKKVDILVGPSGVIECFEGVEFHEISRKKLFLYYSAKNPPEQAGEELSLFDFRNSSFIMRPAKDSRIFREFIRICQEAGFTPNISERSHKSLGLDTVIVQLEMGHSVAIMHEDALLKNNPAFLSMPLNELPLADIVVAWNKEEEKPHVRRFISYLSERL